MDRSHVKYHFTVRFACIVSMLNIFVLVFSDII